MRGRPFLETLYGGHRETRSGTRDLGTEIWAVYYFNRSSARFGTAPYKYSKISNLKKLGRRGRHQ